MVITHFNFSSFSMIISNVTHLVMVFVIEIDMSMNDDTDVDGIDGVWNGDDAWF